jgi:hypothetical protein
MDHRISSVEEMIFGLFSPCEAGHRMKARSFLPGRRRFFGDRNLFAGSRRIALFRKSHAVVFGGLIQFALLSMLPAFPKPRIDNVNPVLLIARIS